MSKEHIKEAIEESTVEPQPALECTNCGETIEFHEIEKYTTREIPADSDVEMPATYYYCDDGCFEEWAKSL